MKPKRSRRRAEHGTDSGYYRHVRQSGGPEPDWPSLPCDSCRRAHCEATKRRAQGKPRPPRAATPRRCPDCGERIGQQSRRCRSCAQKNRARLNNNRTTIRWQRVGLIWKAA